MNSFDYLLNSIASAWVVDLARARLIALGVRWEAWPDGEAKNFVRDWERATPEKRAVVEFKLAQWERALPVQPGELPHDDLELRATYHAGLNRAVAKATIEALKVNPDRVHEICAEVRASTAGVEVEELRDLVIEAGEKKQRDAEAGEALVQLPGFELLSTAIGGVKGGRVVILGAKTGFGKTTAALNLARSASRLGRVVFVNQEMGFDDIAGRAVQVERDVRATLWNEWKLDPSEVVSAAQAMNERHPVFVTNGRSLTLDEIGAVIAAKRPRVVFIDYDQKIATGGGADEWKAMSLTIQRLEEIAKMLDVFVVLLSQFHDDGRLKASERMKQSASAVIFFHRELGRSFFQFQKNRFGTTSERVEVSYDTGTGRIAELALVTVPKTPPGPASVTPIKRRQRVFEK